MRPDQPSDPERQYVTVDGLQMAYSDEGEGDHVVLAIHGLPGSVRDYRWFAPALDGFRIVRIELPGFGESERAEYAPMAIGDRGAAALKFIDALGIETVIAIGHSSGGTVAAQLAASNPGRVSAVGLLATPGLTPHYNVSLYRKFARLFEIDPARPVMELVQRGLYRMVGFPSSLSDRDRTFSTLDAAATDFDQHAANIAALTVPTLSAWAADDRLIPRERFEELDSALPHGPRLRFETGGHNIQKTHAIEIAEALRQMADDLGQ